MFNDKQKKKSKIQKIIETKLHRINNFSSLNLVDF